VIGTQFTWPVGSGRRATYDLTLEKEVIWSKWISLYKEKMLSEGEYRGDLYDIGFDRPEAHAIAKGGNMYYAFYAPEFQGKVELRGLDRRTFKIRDYENGRDLGTVQGPVASMEVQFAKQPAGDRAAEGHFLSRAKRKC
jgi:alpha-galactosidase